MRPSNYGSQTEPQGEDAPQPSDGSKTSQSTAEQKCKQDEARLAQLRNDPSVQRATQLAQNLACERLRPQIQRLMESLGASVVVNSPPEEPGAPKQESPHIRAEVKDQACGQDESRLADLRAHPSPEQVEQFARELICDDLVPQVQRLMESIGLKPIAPDQTRTPGSQAAPAPAATAPTASSSNIVVETGDSAELCKKEADELTRIRANPDRNSVQRFARDMKCDSLKAQVARLMESVGE